MQPIHELLNRIHWDSEFGKGKFELCFQDRFETKLVRLSLDDVTFTPGDHYFFRYLDDEEEEHSVPFHRIKTVYKNGQMIWHREH